MIVDFYFCRLIPACSVWLLIPTKDSPCTPIDAPNCTVARGVAKCPRTFLLFLMEPTSTCSPVRKKIMIMRETVLIRNMNALDKTVTFGKIVIFKMINPMTTLIYIKLSDKLSEQLYRKRFFFYLKDRFARDTIFVEFHIILRVM